MAALDPNLLELQRIIIQIARTGGSLSSSLSNINDAASSSASAQDAVSKNIRRAGDDSANALTALNKRLKLASKSFESFYDVVLDTTQRAEATGEMNSSFIKDISASYQHAKSMLEDQVSKTYTTWSELDKVYPKALKDQITAVAGVTLKIKEYADTLKVDDYIIAQQAFIKTFKENNGKVGHAQLDLLANLHTLGKELEDPGYFDGFAKNAKSAERFGLILDKHSKGVELNKKEIAAVNAYFKRLSNAKITSTLTDAETKLKTFSESILSAAQSTNQVGGSFRNAMLNHLEKTFGEAGHTIRSAITGGMGSAAIGGAAASALGGILADNFGRIFKDASGTFLGLIKDEAAEWMRSGTELHDSALIRIGVSQEAYLKVMAANKSLYRSIAGGQESVDTLMAEHSKEFAHILGGNRALGMEMAARMAAVERNAGGSSQSLEEFSKTLGQTQKWAEEFGQTTALTSEEGLTLYETLLKEGNVSTRLTGMKAKEQLAYKSSIQALLLNTAQLGISKEALISFTEAAAGNNKRTLQTALTSGMGLSNYISMLSKQAGNAELEKKTGRAGYLESLSNRTVPQMKEWMDILSETTKVQNDYDAQIAERSMRAAEQDKISGKNSQQAIDTEQQIYNSRVAVLKSVLQFSDELKKGFADTEKNAKELATREEEISKQIIADKLVDNKETRDRLRAEKIKADKAQAKAWGQNDITVNLGTAAIEVANFTEALKKSQTGIIPGVIMGAMIGTTTGLLTAAIPSIIRIGGSALLGSLTGGGGLITLLRGAAGALVPFAPAVMAAAGAVAAFMAVLELKKGIDYQKQQRIARVIEGEGSWMENKFTTKEEIAEYKAELAKAATTPTEPEKPVDASMMEKLTQAIQPVQQAPYEFSDGAIQTIYGACDKIVAAIDANKIGIIDTIKALPFAPVPITNQPTSYTGNPNASTSAAMDASILKLTKTIESLSSSAITVPHPNSPVAIDASILELNKSIESLGMVVTQMAQPISQLFPTTATPPTGVTPVNTETAQIAQMVETLDTLTATINARVNDMSVSTTTLNRILNNIDKTTSSWYKDVKDEKAKEPSTSLVDLLNKTGGNSTSNVRTGI